MSDPTARGGAGGLRRPGGCVEAIEEACIDRRVGEMHDGRGLRRGRASPRRRPRVREGDVADPPGTEGTALGRGDQILE